ncbi:hypothetical protein TNCV_4696921 [Trichonephila clavipes]|nr:hypothetical protein TNCV_4696921 [Trichonephila clavipes]
MGNSGHCGFNLEAPGESRAFAKPPRHDFLGVFLHWLPTRPTRYVAMPEWMASTCSNALDSMNTPTNDIVLGGSASNDQDKHGRWINK